MYSRNTCMECGAWAVNWPAEALTVESGEGCAVAILNEMLGRGCICGELFRKEIMIRVRVHGFKGSRLHSLPWTALGMRIYEKSVSFVRPNPKIGAKLAIIWEMSIFNGDCGPSLSLTLNVEP